jgi:hypothetical protein
MYVKCYVNALDAASPSGFLGTLADRGGTRTFAEVLCLPNVYPYKLCL